MEQKIAFDSPQQEEEFQLFLKREKYHQFTQWKKGKNRKPLFSDTILPLFSETIPPTKKNGAYILITSFFLFFIFSGLTYWTSKFDAEYSMTKDFDSGNPLTWWTSYSAIFDFTVANYYSWKNPHEIIVIGAANNWFISVLYIILGVLYMSLMITCLIGFIFFLCLAFVIFDYQLSTKMVSKTK